MESRCKEQLRRRKEQARAHRASEMLARIKGGKISESKDEG